MIIREAMYEKSFSFWVVYRSIFGAFIDSIDDDPSVGRFWILYIDGEEPGVGVSEAIISEDEAITSAVLEWRYWSGGSKPSGDAKDKKPSYKLSLA